MSKAKKILLVGSYHGNNKGDEAIFYSFYRYLQDSNLAIKVTTINESYFQEQYSVKTVNPTKIGALFKAIIKSDLIVLGGGGLIFDYSLKDTLRLKGKSQLLFWLLVSLSAKIFRKKVLWLALGIGPLTTRFSRFLTKFTLKFVNQITVRDPDSLTLLNSLTTTKKLSETRDIVFGLKTAKNWPKAKLKGLPPRYYLLIPRYWEQKAKFLNRHFSELIQELLRQKIPVVLTETNYRQDHPLTEALAKKFRSNALFYYHSQQERSLEEFFQLFEKPELIITMRMHPIILGALQNKLSIAIDYRAPKLQGCQQLLGQQNYSLILRRFPAIFELITNLQVNREKQLQLLKTQTQLAKTQAQQNFKILANYLA
jgi:polysaccharide pyruvyl transferase CsaB